MDAFGLAAIHEDKRREKLEKAYHRGFVVTLFLVSLGAAGMIGYHSKVPATPMFLSSADTVRTCGIDHHLDCLICTFTNSEGKVKHKNAHCPALAPSGMMAFPLARR